MIARPYQIEARDNILKRLQTDQSTLAVLATGLGKTFIFNEVARYFTRVLILAHRRELIKQAAARVNTQLGVKPGIEMASRHSFNDNIVVGSIQSVKNRAWFMTPPDLIIIDEAHHAVSNTYQSVLAKFPNAKVLGVTATPDRADQIALGEVFNSVAYRYETPQAIEDGWLTPIIWAEADGVTGLITESFGRRTVVFTPNVASAKWVAQELGGGAGCVHGKMPKKERAEILGKFKKGYLTHMVNCNILTEGFDCPEIECVAMLRATDSRAMFIQTLGRGLRLAPGKQDCLYLDLTMRMPDHSLEGPADCLGAKDTWNSLWM